MGKKEIGFMALGLGLGAAVALLYAPRSGKVTRRYVRAKATSGARYMRDQAEDLRGTAVNRYSQAKRTLADTKESLATAIDAGVQAYRDAQVG
jgi:gas vesicle protein